MGEAEADDESTFLLFSSVEEVVDDDEEEEEVEPDVVRFVFVEVSELLMAIGSELELRAEPELLALPAELDDEEDEDEVSTDVAVIGNECLVLLLFLLLAVFCFSCWSNEVYSVKM